MKNTVNFLTLLFVFMSTLNALHAQPSEAGELEIVYVEHTHAFNEAEKQLIDETIVRSEQGVRELLPDLPKNIKVILETMPRSLDEVGGTTGRAEKHTPYGEVYVYISSVYPGGIEGAVKASLSYTLYHEFHHLARGWTMVDNKFDRGIDIAMVNEGLAVVFGEQYTATVLEGNSVPNEVEQWVDEVLDLPKDANYNTWMNQHPDGRMGIGYRSGHHVILKAMENSGKGVVELSELQPEEILTFAGYK